MTRRTRRRLAVSAFVLALAAASATLLTMPLSR
jgi:hypothetical protein